MPGWGSARPTTVLLRSEDQNPLAAPSMWRTEEGVHLCLWWAFVMGSSIGCSLCGWLMPRRLARAPRSRKVMTMNGNTAMVVTATNMEAEKGPKRRASPLRTRPCMPYPQD